MPLSQFIEAILFATSEPQPIEVLASRLGVSKEETHEALKSLQQSLEGHGIMLTLHDEKAVLVTRPEQSALIEGIRKDELQKELSKAAAETLAIVCYHPGATKAEIEFIRGVNASYSLRALQMRGLIEQKGAGRAMVYHPTIDTLKHFGVSSIEGLPGYLETKQKIDALIKQAEEVSIE